MAVNHQPSFHNYLKQKAMQKKTRVSFIQKLTCLNQGAGEAMRASEIAG
jgi:hypothetical protein